MHYWRKPLETRMTDNPTTALPTIESLEVWRVGIGPNGLPEVRFELKDHDEARAWATWICNRIDEMTDEL